MPFDGIDGKIWSDAINRSTKRGRMGVTDIGLRPLTTTGVHLGTCVITAVCPAGDTMLRPIDIFTSIVDSS